MSNMKRVVSVPMPASMLRRIEQIAKATKQSKPSVIRACVRAALILLHP